MRWIFWDPEGKGRRRYQHALDSSWRQRLPSWLRKFTAYSWLAEYDKSSKHLSGLTELKSPRSKLQYRPDKRPGLDGVPESWGLLDSPSRRGSPQDECLYLDAADTPGTSASNSQHPHPQTHVAGHSFGAKAAKILGIEEELGLPRYVRMLQSGAGDIPSKISRLSALMRRKMKMQSSLRPLCNTILTPLSG